MRAHLTKRLLIAVVALSLSALMLGFVVFAAVATRGVDASTDGHRADGIVVLTGGGARLAEAGRLLDMKRGRRLLISGVNRKTGREALVRLTGLDQAVFDCCVDVGYAALDTLGNADETRAWAERHGFSSLIVVTATYHMPRSLAEFAHVLPGVALVAHGVVPRDFATRGWWLYPSTARVLAAEYVKLLTAYARLAAHDVLWSKDDAAAGAARLAAPSLTLSRP